MRRSFSPGWSAVSKHQHVRGPFLVIAPLSTLINWVRELTAWTDLDVVLYHGSQEDRELIREYEFHYLSRPRAAGFKVQVLVTSFEMAVHMDGARGGRELSQIYWEMLIIDEAHKLKNHKLCLQGLGLRRICHTVEVIDTPSIRGRINKVHYLVKIEG